MLLGTPLYIVGVVDQSREAWDLVGVFRTQKEAERECCDPEHFIRPVGLGEPVEPGCWKGVYFPKET